MPKPMMGFRLNKNLTFFDSKKILKELDKADRKALGEFGALVRREARSRLRPVGKRGIPSRPGRPPRVRSKSKFATLKRIFFAYDLSKRSVVIGPDKLSGRTQQLSGDAQTIPELMEEGGTVRRTRRRKGRRVKQRASYEARPIMKPVFFKNAPTMPKMYKNALRNL